jgi:predicted Zn-dependent protease
MRWALWLMALGAWAEPPQMKAERAKMLFQQGRFADAAELYRQLTKEMTPNAPLYLNLALACGMMEDFACQAEAAGKALKLQPQLPPAWRMGGEAWLRSGRPDLALPLLKKLAAASPEDVEARQLLAGAALGTGDVATAAAAFERLVAVKPEDPAVWYGLGRSYEGLAEREFAKLAKGQPPTGWFFLMAAETRRKESQNRARFYFYREALARLPKQRGIHGGLAEVYRRAGREDWALVEEGREQALGKLNCAARTSECLFSEGRFAELVKSPAAGPAEAYWRARAWTRLAEQAGERLLALPSSAEGFRWRGEGLRKEGRHAEAAAVWREAAAFEPRDPGLRANLVESLILAKDLDGAERELTPLLDAAPEVAELNFYRGQILMERQELDQAVAFLRKAGGLLPAQAALGRALVQLGRGKEAVGPLEAALPMDEDGAIRFQLSRAYGAAGMTEQSGKALREYQEIQKRLAATDEQIQITAP